MTISPPAKVKTAAQELQVLASGIDTLYLAIDVHWASTDHFDYLAELKEIAKQERREAPGHFVLENDKFLFNVKQSGRDGYEWLIYNKEFTFSIGKWTAPISKPSVLVHISSEALWHLGAENTVNRIIEIILSLGGSRITIKPSRVDLCLDVLLSNGIWDPELREYKVNRAAYMGIHFHHRKLTGFSIGKGKLSARLYDKPLEICQQSKKFWMYDIWGVHTVPKGMKIIRVEFQLRREALTELAVKGIDDLFDYTGNLWIYCTQKWLKFQTNPGKHHTQRKVLDWWRAIQDGFTGAQEKHPLIRSKAVSFDIDRNTAQSIGNMRALIAALIAARHLDEYVSAEIEDGLKYIAKHVNRSEENKDEFAASVREKIAKVNRTNSRHMKAEQQRKKLHLPTTH
ncbi:MAG: hypothetical protein C0622_01535 [Desulfuromonas sp.]|nr:MAG: hypothetical protein C0622_01535 [Desulfuromonas sp.]